MKRLLTALAFTLAVNFLVIAGGVGWLMKTGQLDRAKMAAIKAIVFPKQAEASAAQPVNAATTQPAMRLDELLARTSGMPASEQLEYIRAEFDAQMAQLDHSHRKLLAMEQQVKTAQEQVVVDRAKLLKDQEALARKAKESERLATDKGFQDSLALYESMPAKQVKTIFAALEDETVIRYLQAMDARAAGKITREFKSPEESERLKRLMERMRLAQGPAQDQVSTGQTTPADVGR